MPKTLLKKLVIKKFRALNNVNIEFGTHVTVICGKNGTSKSSILGIAAQIFSFEKNYLKDEQLRFQTITGSNFKSLPSEHFRFSDKYDVPGSLDVAVELHDGYSDNDATAELGLFSRGSSARPVVRKNTTAEKGRESRNFTHPVIFLSLKRLQPIASREYKVRDFEYLSAHEQQFINLNNQLLNKTSSSATGTGGSINSAVAHAENYDQDSVSAGEDNAGQIVLALMSFRKLKEEYSDYKGGLLLIDEADAGLFPAAQTKLLEILEKECNDLELQVIMTSHSPTLIERTYDLSKKYQRKFKTVYLSDTFGPVQAMHDISWPGINSDLLTTTVAAPNEISLPKINVYFEDKEGWNFFNTLLFRHKSKKYINQLDDVSLGCANYIQLVRKGVPEFSAKSIIILDGDVEGIKSLNSIILLPGPLPPDQLIFEFLYNLPPSDELWKNTIHFTRPVFTNCASKIISTLSITGNQLNLKSLVDSFSKSNTTEPKVKLREVFKDFYKTPDFQNFLTQKGKNNPWKRWAYDNQAASQEFRSLFTKRLAKTMRDGYGVDESKLIFLENK
ncbi:AAA domain-containing protein [Nitrosospira sp. Nsp11]|uniref:AAA family ATPase n=1 Tax=Nitrosospira sp. Nsp11 TaxID=1855338 RepID=UPI00091AD249|nr:AAA family ATPase [Nitrosospira sp. Nsp11]SHL21218.1 AAA domain-containing protein [Nitrosospira sp. Nsp11]